MSRSYKHFPISRMVLWGRSMKKGKQIANRKIRRKLKDLDIEVGNGRHYKSLGIDSWDLWEFRFLETKQDAIEQWETDLFQAILHQAAVLRLNFQAHQKTAR